MLKKVCVVCLLLSLCLCACSANTVSYEKQEGIGFNYNNISAYNDIWLTNESLCYLEDSLVQNYYLVTGKTRSRICGNSGYGYGMIQNYGCKLYMLDLSNSIDGENAEYLLKAYDVESKNTEEVTTIRNCDNFLVLGDDVFYLQYKWTASARKLTLKRYSVDSGKHTAIQDSVLSFGAIGQTFFYVAEADGVVSVFQYDPQNDTSVECGSFTLEVADPVSFRENVTASYTSDHVILVYGNYQDITSSVWKFSLEEKTVSKTDLNGCITSLIAYDKCSYFAMFDGQNENVTKIFRMTNDTDEMLQIGTLKGDCSLFVGSDAGVYVLEYANNVLNYYTQQDGTRTVCRF